MQRIILTAAIALMAAPAFAAEPPRVPEMDGSAALAAISLLAGLGFILREKMKK